jgi:hypothetical protein
MSGREIDPCEEYWEDDVYPNEGDNLSWDQHGECPPPAPFRGQPPPPPGQLYGCTNPEACNYNYSATIDDGSCISPPCCYTVSNISDWNLVGVPVGVFDPTYSSIYPDAIPGTLYGFNGTYFNYSLLLQGEGYWLRFSQAGETEICGSPIHNLTIPLAQNWNMISGISTAVVLENIIDPDGIIVPGTLYGFNGTYFPSPYLVPGQGYWIRAYESGEITLIGSGHVEPPGDPYIGPWYDSVEH